MTELEKILDVAMINTEDILKAGFNGKEYEYLIVLSNLRNLCKNQEDIQIKQYINESEFVLYNIHTSENTLYIEKYKDTMSDENMVDVMQDTCCFDITEEIDMLDFLCGNYNKSEVEIIAI